MLGKIMRSKTETVKKYRMREAEALAERDAAKKEVGLCRVAVDEGHKNAPEKLKSALERKDRAETALEATRETLSAYLERYSEELKIEEKEEEKARLLAAIEQWKASWKTPETLAEEQVAHGLRVVELIDQAFEELKVTIALGEQLYQSLPVKPETYFSQSDLSGTDITTRLKHHLGKLDPIFHRFHYAVDLDRVPGFVDAIKDAHKILFALKERGPIVPTQPTEATPDANA